MKINKKLSKITGAIVGFAIGDSLGFPAAGIKKRDYLKINKGYIKDFEQNKNHPYFCALKRGQFTDNTRLFLLTIESLIKSHGFALVPAKA